MGINLSVSFLFFLFSTHKGISPFHLDMEMHSLDDDSGNAS